MSVTTLKQSEAQFQRAVIELAERLHWKVAHFHDSRREVVRRDGSRLLIGDKGAKGWPDLALARADRFLVIELKGEKGRLSPEQKDWLFALGIAGVEAHVFRPSDWPEIEKVLR